MLETFDGYGTIVEHMAKSWNAYSSAIDLDFRAFLLEDDPLNLDLRFWLVSRESKSVCLSRVSFIISSKASSNSFKRFQ